MRCFADRIRRARRLEGWSQARLAGNLGVTTSAVGHWERPGGHLPSTENLIEVAAYLSISLEWLAAGRGEMRPAQFGERALGTLSLSDEEEALLQYYRKLDVSSRAFLTQFLSALMPMPESDATLVDGHTEAGKRMAS
ncbi:MAG: helix-turn-helix transcriptional regulator [Wenzhouxiangellaceae bacterium]|nr:helix-turn-helix transcriptional regulator [Wenzhouxiangellaceae bacterium]MBS3746842.1 helix-turn-helix transcriptional regulator [Wenzhouxiangellaceae bacterium]